MGKPPMTLITLGDYNGDRFRYQGKTFVKLHTVDAAVINVTPGQVPALEVPGGLMTALPATLRVIPVPPGSIDFALESTKDIIDELFSRFDHGVFTALRIGYPQSQQFATTTRWHGNGHTCIGMVMDTGIVIQQQLRQNATPGEL